MNQAGSTELSSSQDVNSKANGKVTSDPKAKGSDSKPDEVVSMMDEEQPQTTKESDSVSSKSQEKAVKDDGVDDLDVILKADGEVTSNAEGSESRPDEEAVMMLDGEQPQTMQEGDNVNSGSQEKQVEGDEGNALEVDTQSIAVEDSNMMEWDDLTGDTSNSHKKNNEEKQCSNSVDSSEECETLNMAVVIMDEEFPSYSEDSNNEVIALDKETEERQGSKSQELEKEESVNPLANLREQEKTNRDSEPDVLEIIGGEINSLEKSDSAEISTSSKAKEGSDSSLIHVNKSVTLRSDRSTKKGSEKVSPSEDMAEDGITSEESVLKIRIESSRSKVDDVEEVVELPVEKQPAMIVDLANDDDVGDKSDGGSSHQPDDNELSLADDKAASRDGKKTLKLRSLASLVDISSGDEPSENAVVSTSHADIPAIGEIVEHGVIIGSDEMDGLQLRISNVVGGEDCITGLTVDEDRDTFSSIQISSVTTLIEPMSPEDPNKVNDKSENNEKDSMETCTVEDKAGTADPITESQNSRPKMGDDNSSGLVVSSKVDGKSEETGKSAEDKDKPSDAKNSEKKDTSRPGSFSDIAKNTDSGEAGNPDRQVYYILRSILTMERVCDECYKKQLCEFRIVKKDESGTWGFLCTTNCRTTWTATLPSNHVVEKPRLIFEKLCGMCGTDLASLPRDGQYSWETREFCSKDCLTQHLHEVAGACHMCREMVRTTFIGKYCVRFGSDIHQFCSNTCLEYYKTKIKVCCYCQKNLEKVNKVTSVSNKEYCSSKCLKRAQRRDIGQQNYSDQLPCTVCQNKHLSRYEFVTQQESYQLCSDPCLNVYKYANKVKAVSCCLCFRVMNAEDVAHYLYHGGHQLRVFCSDSCVNVFILSARKIVMCEICKVKKYNFDMIHRQVDEDFRDYFYCSLSCLCTKEASSGKKMKNGVTSTSAKSGSVTNSSSDSPVTVCNMCNAKAKAQYHMVMSDNSLRSFCRYACATKYKNTFGYQVNGIQSAENPQTSPTIVREKPTQKTQVSQAEDKENTSQAKKISMFDSVEEVNSVTAELLRLLTPPTMVNKMTSCRPSSLSKGVFCKPHKWNQEAQTESADINCSLYTSKPPPIIPVPVPVYVPTPMMMYNVPYPVPVVVPVPLPVPIFIPTSAKTSGDIAKLMNKIQDEMPEDPYEAEMLLMARASSESAEAEAAVEGRQENPTVSNDFDSHIAIDDLKDLDISCLDTMEEDLPRFPLKHLDDGEDLNISSALDPEGSDEESEEQNNRKRKAVYEEGGMKKRLRHGEDHTHDSLYNTADTGQQSTSIDFTTEGLGEEYPGSFLNKMYGLAAWKRWVTTKNAELAGVSSSRNMKLITDDLLAMNCEELNYALCLFLKDLVRPNGEPYQPDTVFYLLLGIQQHLFDSGRTDCIFMDFGFEKFTNSFDETTKTFLCEPVPPSVPAVGITRITETMLWECRQLGAHTPQVLLNTLFYFNTKVFKLKTVEDHLALSFTHIVKQWKRTVVGPSRSLMRTSLLKYFAPKIDGEARVVHEMHENRDDPLRCPVKLYEFYLSKCPESVRNQQGMYYVYPERSCVPDSPTWFSSQAVQPTSLSKMLHRTLMVKEIQESFME